MWRSLTRLWSPRNPARRHRGNTSPARRRRLEIEPLEERLALSWATVPPATLTPPTSPAALTLNALGDARGTIGIASKNVDYYAFTAPVGGNYRLAATTPASAMDTVLAVYDSAGKRLAYNNDVSPGVNTDSELSLKLAANQRVFFGVTNLTGTPGGLAYDWLVDGPIARDDAYEDNDARLQAADLGTLAATQTYSGLVLADGEDWYRFTMTGFGTALAGDTVSISFQNSEGNLELELYDAAGTLLRFGRGTGNVESTPLALRPPGTYYVRVYGAAGALNPAYSLTVNPGTDDGYEDNDSQAAAADLGQLTAVRNVSAQLADAEDWYRFTMDGIGTSADFVNLAFQHSQGNLDLKLYDAAGSPLAVSATSSATQNSERISLQGLGPGTYLVRVYSPTGDWNPGYTLTVDPALDDAYENNDSFAQARNLGMLTGVWWATGLVMADGADWYKFTAEGFGTTDSFAQVDFTPAQGQLEIRLFGNDGFEITPAGYHAGDTRLSLRYLRPGTYYVRVSGVNGALNPDYALTIVPGQDDPYEDNDGINSARDFGALPHAFRLADLQLVDAADWYRFTMTGFGGDFDYVHLEASGFAGDLELLDASGTPIANADSHGTVSLDDLSPGAYYVRVTDPAGGFIESYALSFYVGTDDQYEENDSLAQARDVGLITGPWLGLLVMADGADWFRFTQEGYGDSTDEIRISFDQSLGDLGLRLYGSRGNLLATSNGTTGEEHISLDGRRPETYYVEVYGALNPEYELHIFPGADDHYEDNDTRDKAYDFGTLSRSRSLGDAGLQLVDSDDWFSFYLPSTLTGFHVDLQFQHAQGNLDLEVYDGGGVLLGRSRTGNNAERLDLTGLTPSRRYFVRVYSSTVIDVGDGLVEDRVEPDFNPSYNLYITT